MPANNSNAIRAKRNAIAVLVADDHGVLRDGLAALLRRDEDIRIVGTVADGMAVLREAERLRPRVVLLGLALSALSTIEAARSLIEKVPDVSVVIVSMQSSPAMVRQALEAGALGYLGKESSGEDVLKAVRSVVSGKRYLGHGLAEKIVEEQRPTARSEAQGESLTATERNILRLVTEGKSNAEVAEIIGLSARTVETYRLRLMRKLGIGDLASLVKYAIRQGITSLE